jgi:hypothetical protein
MTWNFQKQSALLGLGLGLLAGLLFSGFWPSVPLHAVSTDKIESFSMATGQVEGEAFEAVYFLDHLTGDLNAFVIGRSATGGFGVIQHCRRNVMQDFTAEEGKTPKFIMTTGLCDLNRQGRGNILYSRSVLYIADVIGGTASAYALPYNQNQHVSGKPFYNLDIIPLCTFPIRKVVAPAGSKRGKSAAAADAG